MYEGLRVKLPKGRGYKCLGTPPVNKTQMNWVAAQWESHGFTSQPRGGEKINNGRAWAVIQLAGCLTCGHSTEERTWLHAELEAA